MMMVVYLSHWLFALRWPVPIHPRKELFREAASLVARSQIRLALLYRPGSTARIVGHQHFRASSRPTHATLA
jgi:hypothetical protein